MAMVLLIARPVAGQPVFGPEAAHRLAELGISRIAVLADDTALGVVLEGWAFDPTHVDDAVRAMFPDGGAGVGIFHEIEHVAVSLASGEGIT